jgi:chorismate synthase
MGVVAETMTALVLANEVTRKFGADSVGELVRNYEGFLIQVKEATARVVDSRGDDEAPLNWDRDEAFESPGEGGTPEGGR